MNSWNGSEKSDVITYRANFFGKPMPEDVFEELMKKTDREKTGGREPANYNNIKEKQTNETE